MARTRIPWVPPPQSDGDRAGNGSTARR